MVTKTVITKSIIALSLFGAIVTGAMPAFAQSASPTAVTAGTSKLTDVIAKGDQFIAQRLTSLNTLLTQINSAKRLQAADKSIFTTSVNAAVSGLSSLKTKIDADTDLVTARTDVKSIFTTYRVYALFDPQTHLLIAADTMTTSADLLDDVATKLETRITAVTGNTDSLKSLLTDMRAKIADARTQYENVETQIAALKPSDYNTSPSAITAKLQTARTEIKTGRTDLQTALQDAKNIRLDLKSLKTTVTGAAASPSATITK